MRRLIGLSTFALLLFLSSLFHPILAQNVTIHPIPDFLSVNSQELNRTHFPPEMARNLEVAVCKKHFPIGSQGRRNVQAVVDLFNDTPYLGIRMTLSEIKHFSEDALYTCPPPFYEDLVIDIVVFAPGPNVCNPPHDTLENSGSIAYYLYDRVSKRFRWHHGPHVFGDYGTQKAALLLRSKDFKPYTDTPLSNIPNAPGQGIIAHELAHTLYAGHPEDRPNGKYRMMEGLCNRRGGIDCVGVTHESDKMIPRITAYTRFLYDKKYPPIPAFVDNKHEWVIHQIINKKNHLSEMSIRDYRPIRYMNPFELYFDPANRKLMDAKTRRVIWLHSQFSDASKLPTSGSILLTIKIRDRVTKNEIMLVSESIPIHTTSDYAQYHFDQHLHTQFFDSDLAPFYNSTNLELVFKVDTDQKYSEYNERNNRLATPITLVKKSSLASGSGDPDIDPDEANVANKKDFRFASIYMENMRIAFDINFYKHLNLSTFRLFLDTDQDGRPDFKISCKNKGYEVFKKTGTNSFTELIVDGASAITGGRYKFCFRYEKLDVQIGDNIDYWLAYGSPIKDRLPDVGKYTFTVL